MIKESLINIFRKSVDLGEISSMWRKANVVPNFKKGDRAIISYYRPVSLTSIVGKLLVLLQIRLENIWKGLV